MTKYIFDLDNTLWDCSSSDGTSIFAKHMIPPFEDKDGVVLDGVNSVCRLHDGVKSFLSDLRKNSHSIGFLSVGAKFKTSMEEQPSVLLLKAFGIYELFDAEKILDYYLDEDNNKITKECYLKDIGPCVFVDDDDRMLESAKRVVGVSVVDRKMIKYWTEILP